jgi:hypothetical protein
MVQGFYTLEEAANFLDMAPEELNRMAQKREIRAFADRGTWRFRTQDIEELGRRRAATSAPKKAEDEGVFGFSLGADENIEIGQELVPDPGTASKSGGRKSALKKPGDSEMRLALDEDFNLQMGDDPAASPRPKPKRKTGFQPADTGAKSGTAKRRSGLAPPPRQDSDVKLSPKPGQEEEVRLESDSKKGMQDSMVVLGEQPPRQPQDSDVRLEHGTPPRTGLRRPADNDSVITEEIDLDAVPLPPKRTSGLKRKTKAPPPPSVSPFELSEADLPMADLDDGGKGDTDSAFDLALEPEEGGELKLSPRADEDDALDLGAAPAGGDDVGKSAIFRQKPADSAARRAADEDIDFDLDPDLEAGGPASGLGEAGERDFELTLDEDEATAQSGGEKDIFETDFDLPALDEESGSKAVALEEVDTDLESSDFDLALDEGAAAEDSGSEVVPLDEVEAPKKPRGKKPAPVVDEESLEGSIDELLSDDAVADLESEAEEEAEEEDEELEPVGAAAAPPQPWGVVPLLLLIPSVIVLMLVGMMGFELLHGMWGYQQSNKATTPLIRSIAGLFVEKADLPKE